VDVRRFALNSPKVIGEAIDGEVMIINLESGIYYSLTGTAAAAWPLVASGVPAHSIAESVAVACAADPGAVARDFAVFIGQLLAESIIRGADPADSNGATTPPPGAAAYTGFALNRYDDMRALLVVDPVHEVGDFGWPPPPEPPRTSQ